MNDLELTRSLEPMRSAVFTSQQLASILALPPSSVAVKLSRLTERGVLIRVMRNRYCLPDTDVLSIASGIYRPSYVTGLAALAYYGITTQTPRVIDVINTNHSGKIEIKVDTGSHLIRFIQVKKGSIIGFNKVYIPKVANIASKEKVIIDGLQHTGYCPLDEIFTCAKEGINAAATIRFARQTRKQTVIKRVGYILQKAGYDISSEEMGPISDTYITLDPALPRRGEHDARYRVIVNRVIE
jgi:predicted transcriptional regulator of viral defense system